MNHQQEKPGPSRAQRRAEKPTDKSGEERTLFAAKIGTALSLILFIIMYSVNSVKDCTEALDPWILTGNTIKALIFEIVVTLVTVMLYRYCKSHPNFGTLEIAFTLAVEKLIKHRDLKNAHQIAPALQEFLYTVLRRNRNVLGFDPGPDVQALSPNGWRTIYRNNTVYYVYELVTSAPPQMGTDILLLLLNQFITAERNNYGIVNLPSQFTDYDCCTYPTVYADRVTYDDVRHMLIFEMLYVGSHSAANALTQAQKRDRPKAAKPIADVFDDEI